MRAPDHDSRFVELKWVGPFSYGKSGLGPSLRDPFGPDREDVKKYKEKAGIYLIIGDHQTHGPKSLLYIGSASNFQRRLEEHDYWLRDEWRSEIYLAELDEMDTRSLKEIEHFLIYAHSPHYCTEGISSCNLQSHLRIWNTGRYWKLLPELSSQHPWYPDAQIDN